MALKPETKDNSIRSPKYRPLFSDTNKTQSEYTMSPKTESKIISEANQNTVQVMDRTLTSKLFAFREIIATLDTKLIPETNLMSQMLIYSIGVPPTTIHLYQE
ncbi:hypothetical protein AYI69_g11353 [Smittium culicis]|uniref:Uncharacterized protein n=1 Tax=Smittium culicis TaxID=133412 RepID=A0A1R1WZA1_9FUNG|nr:hypothetical protein AYI69_g11353 [Smittium culicis]